MRWKSPTLNGTAGAPPDHAPFRSMHPGSASWALPFTDKAPTHHHVPFYLFNVAIPTIPAAMNVANIPIMRNCSMQRYFSPLKWWLPHAESVDFSQFAAKPIPRTYEAGEGE